MRALRGLHPLDVVAVLAVTAGWEWQVFHGDTAIGTHVAGPRALTVALPLLLAVPLLWRRQRPLLACALVMAGLAAQALASGNSPEGLELLVAWVLAAYGVAAYGDRRTAFAGLGVLLAGFAVYALENHDVRSGTADNVWASAFFLLLVVATWLAGVVVHGRREAAALERSADEAVARERARVARELHDIVAHNLSVVVVQAAGAQAQGSSGGALEKIERSGREALVEMRRLLGVLREDGATGDGGGLTPQPTIGDLTSLAERLRAAGLPVELTIAGDCDGLAPAVELTGYRIVQEALTNTLKHAGPGARARVQVERHPDALTIEVADDGPGADDGSADDGGHGLAGMRERVALFGGELRAGARPAGGFVVSARLPLVDGRQ
jgi:signal transduction histidine kinase